MANFSVIKNVAGSNATPTAEQLRQVVDAIRLADLWLDDVTDLPSGVVTVQAWSRVDWIERTLPAWSTLCDPVAGQVVAAMGEAVGVDGADAGRSAGDEDGGKRLRHDGLSY